MTFNALNVVWWNDTSFRVFEKSSVTNSYCQIESSFCIIYNAIFESTSQKCFKSQLKYAVLILVNGMNGSNITVSDHRNL